MNLWKLGKIQIIFSIWDSAKFFSMNGRPYHREPYNADRRIFSYSMEDLMIQKVGSHDTERRRISWYRNEDSVIQKGVSCHTARRTLWCRIIAVKSENNEAIIQIMLVDDRKLGTWWDLCSDSAIPVLYKIRGTSKSIYLILVVSSTSEFSDWPSYHSWEFSILKNIKWMEF